eukprot:Tamp_40496.p1 GENE.Tamp_40496~~Tamp_40496.p1  ORF type:complete len:134 (-),score=30.36 Tamp_40496:51-398(-)
MRHRVDHIMASRELPRECEGGTSPGQARQLSPDPHYHDRRGGWLYHVYGEEAQARLAQPEDTALYGTNKQGGKKDHKSLRSSQTLSAPDNIEEEENTQHQPPRAEIQKKVEQRAD